MYLVAHFELEWSMTLMSVMTVGSHTGALYIIIMVDLARDIP